MDKWEKVVTLHRLLRRSRYSVPLEKILAELDCSKATFYRIRNFMQSKLGAPVEKDHRYGGYRYTPSEKGPFELPGFWFTKDEIEAFLLLDGAIENLHEGYFTELLRPVRKRFEPLLKAQSTTTETLRKHIKIIPIASRECNRDTFRSVASAIISRRTVGITHLALETNETVRREISPLALIRYRDNWYVDAFCHLRGELRTFALNRIESVRTLSTPFHNVSLRELESFFAQSYGIFTGPADKLAVIDFTDAAAREVSCENWHPRQKGDWIDETTFRLTIPYGHQRELVMDILRWGEHAQVAAPAELREILRGTIEKMREKYK